MPGKDGQISTKPIGSFLFQLKDQARTKMKVIDLFFFYKARQRVQKNLVVDSKCMSK